MRVVRFLVRRLLLVPPVLAGIFLVAFVLVRVGGQDPVGLLAGPTATADEIRAIAVRLGLDRPIWAQFLLYVEQAVGGDFGRSWITGRPVLDDVLERLPATLELLLCGLALGTVIGIPVGLIAAEHHDRPFDHISRFLSLLGFSIPTYWLGLAMLLIFFYLLGWAPPGMGRISLLLSPPPRVTGSYLIDALIAGDLEAARSALAQLALPVICIAIVASAPIIKQTRAIALEVRSSDFVRYAEASGLGRHVERRIVLRNSATPLVTFIGTELAGLLGTTSLIEYVFAWGGLGQYGLNAIIQGDFAVVQTYVVALAAFTVLVFLVVDLAVLLMEPRAGLR